MGWGRLTGWTSLFQPFFDRLDIQIPVVWYRVPPDAPPGPATTFTDRFDDARENWLALTPGQVVGSMRPYFGALPAYEITPQIGTDAEFIRGISYEDYVNNRRPASPCWVVDPPTEPVRERMVMYFAVHETKPETLLPGGVLVGGSDAVVLPPVLSEVGGVLVGGSDAVVLPPVLSEVGGVLVGGSDAVVLPPVLSEVGGVLVGGSDDYYNHGCVNCPGGARFYGSLTCVGAADGTQPAALLNDTFTLAYVSGCTYQSATFVPYAGSPACRWRVIIQPTGCQIALARASGSGTPAFTLPNVAGAGCLTDAVVNPTTQGAPVWDLSGATFTWHPLI